MKLTKDAANKLRQLRDHVNLKNACFDSASLSIGDHIDDLKFERSNQSWNVIVKGYQIMKCGEGWKMNDPFEQKLSLTEFIRLQTKLHRDSWINPIIDELLEGAPK